MSHVVNDMEVILRQQLEDRLRFGTAFDVFDVFEPISNLANPRLSSPRLSGVVPFGFETSSRILSLPTIGWRLTGLATSKARTNGVLTETTNGSWSRRRISSHGRLATSAMPSAARFIESRIRTPVLSGLSRATFSTQVRTSRVPRSNRASNNSTPIVSIDSTRPVSGSPKLVPRLALEAPKIDGERSLRRNGSLSFELP
jgi:hypothetical protein